MSQPDPWRDDLGFVYRCDGPGCGRWWVAGIEGPPLCPGCGRGRGTLSTTLRNPRAILTMMLNDPPGLADRRLHQLKHPLDGPTRGR